MEGWLRLALASLRRIESQERKDRMSRKKERQDRILDIVSHGSRKHYNSRVRIEHAVGKDRIFV